MLELKKYNLDSFPKIYEDMLLQFPACELKTFEKFCKLLEKNEDYNLFAAEEMGKSVGYILLFEDKITNCIWIDYIAVFKNFHSGGYGTKMMLCLKEYFKGATGCFLEVEKPDVTVQDTIRRIKFYKKFSAEKLDINYLYPNECGYLPMDLYFVPYENKMLQKSEIIDTIKHAFDRLHFDIEHIDTVFSLICKQM